MAKQNKPIENLLKYPRENVVHGKSLFEQGKYKEAERYFLLAIKVEPKNEQAHFGLGKIYCVQHKPAAAEKALKTTVSINKKNKYAYIELGKVLVEQGKGKEAEKYFLQSVKLDPGNEEAHYELGKVYYGQNKLARSEKELKKAIRINKKYKYAHILLAKIYRAMGKYGPSLKIFQNLIKSNPQLRLEILSETGSLYEAMGKYDDAIKAYKEAIKTGFDNAQMRLALAKLYHMNGENNNAIDECKESIKRGMGNAEIHLVLARTYDRKGQDDDTIKQYKETIRKGMDNAEIRLALARLYGRNRQDDDAVKEYKEIIRQDNDNAKIHLDIAEVYSRNGEFDKEILEYKEAISKGVDNVQVHLKLADAYYKNRQYVLAEAQYVKVYKIAPSVQILRALIKIYKKLKKIDLCIEAGNKLVEIENEEDRRYNNKLVKMFKFDNKGKGVVEDLAVKIIRTPYFDKSPKNELDYCLLLPIGMSRIVSYLRSNGIKVDQDDLYIKVNHDNIFAGSNDKVDGEVFFDEKRVIEYAQGKQDIYIDSVLEKIEEKTELKGYKVVLISLPVINGNSSGYMFVLAFARYLKKKYNPVIIVGGSLVNDFINYDLKNIDLVIMGKGEKPLFEILTALKYRTDINKIPDISICNDGKLIQNLQSKLNIVPDYDGLPVTLYGYKAKEKQGKSYDKDIKSIINEFNSSELLVSPAILMEGCSYECAFCCDSASPYLLSLTPKKAVIYLKELKRKYGIRNFLFFNNTINLSKKYINALCDEIIKSGMDILWSDCARADNLDRETLFKMRKAGCIRLIFGMETASPRLLKYVDKQINLKRLENILSWADEAGIWSGIEVICGFPHETKEDRDKTIDFLNKNREIINASYHNIFYLRSGSLMYEHPENFGIKNISQIDTYKCKEGDLGLIRFSFDEIRGLKWKEKLNKIKEGFEHTIKETGGIKNSFQRYEMEHFLFYLYSKYKDKKEIMKIFKKVNEARATAAVS